MINFDDYINENRTEHNRNQDLEKIYIIEFNRKITRD